MNVRNLFRNLTLAAITISAQAHPGHEPFSEGATHFISNPSHLLPSLLFGAALFIFARLLKRRGERSFLRITAIAIAATTLFS